MKRPNSVREVLMAEAIADLAKLLEAMERLPPEMRELRSTIERASSDLNRGLTEFENRVMGITENAKVQASRHMAVRATELSRQSVNSHSQAMADAARVAFGAQIGATLERLQAQNRRPSPRWESWLTHAAALVTGAAASWSLALIYLYR